MSSSLPLDWGLIKGSWNDAYKLRDPDVGILISQRGSHRPREQTVFEELLAGRVRANIRLGTVTSPMPAPWEECLCTDGSGPSERL